MAIKNRKIVEMNIRKQLPDDYTYTEKCIILEILAEEYRDKARKEIREEVMQFKNKKNEKQK